MGTVSTAHPYPLVQRLGGQARDSRDKSECDSAVCSSLHGTQYTGLPFGLFDFLTWTVQLFLPGPCPRGLHPGDGVGDMDAVDFSVDGVDITK